MFASERHAPQLVVVVGPARIPELCARSFAVLHPRESLQGRPFRCEPPKFTIDTDDGDITAIISGGRVVIERDHFPIRRNSRIADVSGTLVENVIKGKFKTRLAVNDADDGEVRASRADICCSYSVNKFAWSPTLDRHDGQGACIPAQGGRNNQRHVSFRGDALKPTKYAKPAGFVATAQGRGRVNLHGFIVPLCGVHHAPFAGSKACVTDRASAEGE